MIFPWNHTQDVCSLKPKGWQVPLWSGSNRGNLPQVCPMVELSIAFNMAHDYSDDFPVGTSIYIGGFPSYVSWYWSGSMGIEKWENHWTKWWIFQLCLMTPDGSENQTWQCEIWMQLGKWYLSWITVGTLQFLRHGLQGDSLQVGILRSHSHGISMDLPLSKYHNSMCILRNPKWFLDVSLLKLHPYDVHWQYPILSRVISMFGKYDMHTTMICVSIYIIINIYIYIYNIYIYSNPNK